MRIDVHIRNLSVVKIIFYHSPLDKIHKLICVVLLAEGKKLNKEIILKK